MKQILFFLILKTLMISSWQCLINTFKNVVRSANFVVSAVKVLTSSQNKEAVNFMKRMMEGLHSLTKKQPKTVTFVPASTVNEKGNLDIFKRDTFIIIRKL